MVTTPPRPAADGGANAAEGLIAAAVTRLSSRADVVKEVSPYLGVYVSNK